MNTQPTENNQATDDAAFASGAPLASEAAKRDRAEDTIGDVYMNLIKIKNHLSLLKRALRNDLEPSRHGISEGVADLYVENLEAIEETLLETQKYAVRVICFFDGDSCD